MLVANQMLRRFSWSTYSFGGEACEICARHDFLMRLPCALGLVARTVAAPEVPVEAVQKLAGQLSNVSDALTLGVGESGFLFVFDGSKHQHVVEDLQLRSLRCLRGACREHFVSW